ncbi:MAG: carboxyl transferase domain-containing protein [Bacilli bacterium]|nr:carboxyl transferase domain-containing protein [Bacilli bacterium]
MLYNLIDEDSFSEYIVRPNLFGCNIINKKNKSKSKEPDNAAIIGICKISDIKVLVIILNKAYKLGTMGVFEGEKITLAFEYATKKRIPVLSITASGGVRVQEGIPALMQMVKTVNALKKHSKKGLLYISIITDPTLGGVSASFVSLADIIIAEQGAIYGFSGKRIINETTYEKISDDFQTSEFAKKHGMVDIVGNKKNIKEIVVSILKLHR